VQKKVSDPWGRRRGKAHQPVGGRGGDHPTQNGGGANKAKKWGSPHYFDQGNVQEPNNFVALGHNSGGETTENVGKGQVGRPSERNPKPDANPQRFLLTKGPHRKKNAAPLGLQSRKPTFGPGPLGPKQMSPLALSKAGDSTSTGSPSHRTNKNRGNSGAPASRTHGKGTGTVCTRQLNNASSPSQTFSSKGCEAARLAGAPSKIVKKKYKPSKPPCFPKETPNTPGADRSLLVKIVTMQYPEFSTNGIGPEGAGWSLTVLSVTYVRLYLH